MYARRLCIIQFLAIAILMMFAKRGLSQKTQLNPQNIANPIDLIDVLGGLFSKKAAPRSDSLVEGVKNISLLPIVGYGPANGAVLGAAVSASSLLGNRENTQLSSALMSISITSKEQLLLAARSNIYMPGNKWYIPGDVRFLLFAQPTYGLGIYGLNSTATFNINGVDLKRTFLNNYAI